MAQVTWPMQCTGTLEMMVSSKSSQFSLVRQINRRINQAAGQCCVHSGVMVGGPAKCSALNLKPMEASTVCSVHYPQCPVLWSVSGAGHARSTGWQVSVVTRVCTQEAAVAAAARSAAASEPPSQLTLSLESQLGIQWQSPFSSACSKVTRPG